VGGSTSLGFLPGLARAGKCHSFFGCMILSSSNGEADTCRLVVVLLDLALASLFARSVRIRVPKVDFVVAVEASDEVLVIGEGEMESAASAGVFLLSGGAGARAIDRGLEVAVNAFIGRLAEA
jgi:hypothetical protein